MGKENPYAAWFENLDSGDVEKVGGRNASMGEMIKGLKKEGIRVPGGFATTAEDLPEASFAGQQEIFLNVRGEEELMEACKRCYASLFTDRAIAYWTEHGFDDMKVALSIGVQKMVRSDKAGSGVMFSIDTETGFKEAVLINAAWGLGEKTWCRAP